MSVDLSLLDVPVRQPVKDPQAYLQAAVQWHFSPETGCPYWLERAKALDFDPLTEVTTFEDLVVGKVAETTPVSAGERGIGWSTRMRR